MGTMQRRNYLPGLLHLLQASFFHRQTHSHIIGQSNHCLYIHQIQPPSMCNGHISKDARIPLLSVSNQGILGS